MATKKKAKNVGRNNCIYIHGQEYQVLGDFKPTWTLCCGTAQKRCGQRMEAKMGVLEPRCSDCYRQQVEWLKSQRK